MGSRFFALLTKQSDLFREKIYQNMPKIQATLESLVRFIFKALDATTQLGTRLWSILTRVYDFFVRLDKATDGWSTKILGAIAIWKLLNLSFLATPLGLSLGLALLTLYDDFKTFQEGGKTLIDWGSDTTKLVVGLVTILRAELEVAVLAVSAAMKTWAVLSGIIAALKDLNLVLAITDALALVLEAPFWLIAAGIAAVTAALTAADAKWQIFGGHLSGFVTGIGSSVLNWLGGLGGANLAPNIGATGGVPGAARGARSRASRCGTAEPTVVAARAAARQAPVVLAGAELRRALRLLDHRGLGHLLPLLLQRKSMLVRNSVASSSFLAVVTMTMSIPRILSTLS